MLDKTTRSTTWYPRKCGRVKPVQNEMWYDEGNEERRMCQRVRPTGTQWKGLSCYHSRRILFIKCRAGNAGNTRGAARDTVERLFYFCNNLFVCRAHQNYVICSGFQVVARAWWWPEMCVFLLCRNRDQVFCLYFVFLVLFRHILWGIGFIFLVEIALRKLYLHLLFYASFWSQ